MNQVAQGLVLLSPGWRFNNLFGPPVPICDYLLVFFFLIFNSIFPAYNFYNCRFSCYHYVRPRRLCLPATQPSTYMLICELYAMEFLYVVLQITDAFLAVLVFLKGGKKMILSKRVGRQPLNI